jgi:mRNA-degrading endonuclease RelE of RelBE toxin-antitoxin system
MDKISKALKKLTEKERRLIRDILQKINSGKLKGLDLKKLVGREDIFRVRKGDLRVILRLEKKKYYLLTIERRSEKTYRDV